MIVRDANPGRARGRRTRRTACGFCSCSIFEMPDSWSSCCHSFGRPVTMRSRVIAREMDRELVSDPARNLVARVRADELDKQTDKGWHSHSPVSLLKPTWVRWTGSYGVEMTIDLWFPSRSDGGDQREAGGGDRGEAAAKLISTGSRLRLGIHMPRHTPYSGSDKLGQSNEMLALT